MQVSSINLGKNQDFPLLNIYILTEPSSLLNVVASSPK